MNISFNRLYRIFSKSNKNTNTDEDNGGGHTIPTPSIPTCFLCGHPLVWESDLCRSDVGLVPDDLSTEEALERDSIIEQWSCRHCGTHYEITLPSKEEVKECGFAPLYLGEER